MHLKYIFFTICCFMFSYFNAYAGSVGIPEKVRMIEDLKEFENRTDPFVANLFLIIGILSIFLFIISFFFQTRFFEEIKWKSLFASLASFITYFFIIYFWDEMKTKFCPLAIIGFPCN